MLINLLSRDIQTPWNSHCNILNVKEIEFIANNVLHFKVAGMVSCYCWDDVL